MTEPPTKKQKTEIEKTKGYQYKSKKRHFLEIGQKGFLATCNFHEKDCVRECYNILSHYADELYGKEPKAEAKNDDKSEKKTDDEEEKETDISDDLQKEIDAVKAESEAGRSRRFQAVDTGTKNCVFIKTTLDNPVELGEKLIKDIAEKKIHKTRHLLRLTPIEVVCRATVEEITKAGKALFAKYFKEEGRTFRVVFNKRYNNEVKRDDIIKVLADMVLENKKNKVDLKNGDVSVIVEIIKGKCCMSVVEGYLKYKKFNLAELSGSKPADAPKKPAAKEEEEEDEKDSEEVEEKKPGKQAASGDAAKRKTTSEEDHSTPAKKPVPIPDLPIGNKLKELLERKKPSDDEPTAKKFKEDESQENVIATTPEKVAKE